ncbi:MAG: hypothetical protein HN383_04560 [Verrucomicrobia bacterium]|jgi:hypothetical protein|nr:hypothetical protein [Verrucomicrobiota bacterium]
MDTVKQRILTRMKEGEPSKAYSPKDFLDLGSRGSVDMALSQLVDAGSIRRVIRGIYDYPRSGKLIAGPVSPKLNEVARAIARKHGWRILGAGAHAANILGLSTQVPAKALYLSDGPTRSYKLDRRAIQFKHAEPKTLGAASEVNGLVVQALRYIGKNVVTDAMVRRIARVLSEPDRRTLLHDTQYSTDWIHEVAKAIVGEGEKQNG